MKPPGSRQNGPATAPDGPGARPMARSPAGHRQGIPRQTPAALLPRQMPDRRAMRSPTGRGTRTLFGRSRAAASRIDRGVGPSLCADSARTPARAFPGGPDSSADRPARHPPSAERHDQALAMRGALSPRSRAPHSLSAALLSRSAPPSATAAFTETLSGRTEVAKEARQWRDPAQSHEPGTVTPCGGDSKL
jgi:hypothetical protein